MTRTVIGILLIAFVCGCGEDARESQRKEFVRKYVESIHRDSELHRKFTSRSNLVLVEYARPHITPEIRFIRREYNGPGDYEYIIEFSNGRTGLVGLFEDEGEIAQAGFFLNPADEEDQSPE